MRANVLPIAVLVVVATLAAATPRAIAETEPNHYTISGTVESDAGEPLAGVHVSGYTSPPNDGDARASHFGYRASATTDGAGRFEMRLPSGKGTLHVHYEKWGQGQSQDILVEGENLTGIRFTLQTPPPKTAIVEGFVRDAAGNPVSGATVWLEQGCCYAYPVEPEPVTEEAQAKPEPMVAPAPGHWEPSQQVVTREDGAFRFETYGGPRVLTVNAPGYAHIRHELQAKDDETVTAQLTLEKVPDANAILKGRVVDAKTGLPVTGAQVSFQNLEWSRYRWVEAGKDGTFELTSVPGWSQLRVNVYNHGYTDEAHAAVSSDGAVADVAILPRPGSGGGSGPGYYGYVESLRLHEGTNEVTLRLEPKAAPTIVLTGYLVDPEKQAGIPGATINVRNEDTGDWGSATTDATGSYKLLVRPGHYTADAWAKGHLGSAGTFAIAEGETAKRFDLKLHAGEAKWAPCDGTETGCGYHHAYAEKGEARAEPAPAPALREEAVEADAGPTAARPASSQSGGASAETAGAPAYVGEGGGLPPYDPADTSATGVRGASQTNAVPAPGLAALLATLALAGMARRARRA